LRSELLTGIEQAFAGSIKGAVERTPLSVDELRFEDGAVVSLPEARCRALDREDERSCEDGREILWTRWRPNSKAGGETYRVHERADLPASDRSDDFLVVKPSVACSESMGEEVPRRSNAPSNEHSRLAA